MALTRTRIRFPRSLSRWSVVTLACLGCTVGPDYAPPEVVMPDRWYQELQEGLAEGTASLESWWTLLDDPILDRLIDVARANSLDVRTAVARILEARAQLGIASGERYPIIDATGDYRRTRQSEDTVPFVFSPGPSRTDDFWSLGLDTSWEVDLFGRIRRSIETADAEFQATIEDYRDVLVTLTAEVALSYIDVRTFQERIRYAEQNAELQRGTRQLTADRFDAKIAPELDVRQAELNLATTESVIPALKIGLAQAMHRLGVLLGQHPATLLDELSPPGTIPQPPTTIVVGLPTELLRQRPDIRRAERALASQVARIGVATADLYPRLSLVGTFAFEALDFADVFQSSSRAYSLGPSVRWNLFDGQRIRNNVRAEDARSEQALLQYEQTVLLALEEVENSMVGFIQETERRNYLEQSVTAASRSVELVKTLYRTGLTDFQNVLDSERSLASQQDQLAESEGFVVQNLVRLYRALGGGWEPPSEPEMGSEEDEATEDGSR